jgi:rare lipoprotein A (peptidoglycan hydrolase)
MRKHTAHGLAILLSVVSLGAAQGPISSGSGSPQKVIPQPQGVASPAAKRNTKAYQVGTASWYGTSFHGRPTASGEPYNMFDLTAAHPTLPLGTHVRVTNLRNGRAVVVRINDRGPAVPGRIIDLSYSAARVLDLKAWGLQRVRLDVVKPQTVAVLRPVEN